MSLQKLSLLSFYLLGTSITKLGDADTSPTYRQFLMFHATLLMIPTCFMHIICHIYAFSGTNLLTRCRRASCCFLLFLVLEILVTKYSRNWTKSSPRVLFLHGASRRPKREGNGATRRRDHRAARPRPWPRRPMVWGPRVAPRVALPLLKASVAKTPVPRATIRKTFQR